MTFDQVDPAEVMGRLDKYARELDGHSKRLAEINRSDEIEQYTEYVEDFIAGLYDKYLAGDGKWPSEDVRVALAKREMPTELRGRAAGLLRERERRRQRIKDLQGVIDAERSVLSALKVEMEATR